MATRKISKDSKSPNSYRDAWFELAAPRVPNILVDLWKEPLVSRESILTYNDYLRSPDRNPDIQQRFQAAVDIVKKSGRDLIHSFPLVTAVAASLRYINGIVRADEPCITFFVVRKLPSYDLKDREIPPTIGGVPTDVVEAGTPRLLATGVHVPGKRARPADPGMSVSHLRVSSGTFGCLVEDENAQYILSCAHVLSDAHGMLTDPIVQPGTNFGGMIPADQIARLSRAIPLTSGTSIADAAIAAVDDVGDVTANIRGIGKPVGTRTLSGVGLLVQKSADQTGVTHGVVVGIGRVGPLTINGVANVEFKDVILTTGMSEPGDSGAVLMDYRRRAIGLLFGGLEFESKLVVSWYHPIDTVLTSLRVTLVT